MTVFFTSDWHLGHDNILEYCNRPFSSIGEMEETLIENFNSMVKPGDLTYFLGDFALCSPEKVMPFVKRLNGVKHLIRGNHDRWLKHKKFGGNDGNFGFGWVGDYKNVSVNGQHIICSHYPFASWHGSHRGWWHAHGHTHAKNPVYDPTIRRINIGVDAWDYKPVSFEQLETVVSGIKWVQVDHHDL